MKRTLAIFAILLLPLVNVHAQGGAAARVTQEIIEQLASKGGSTAAKQIADLGGDVAVREMLEAAEKEGGEALLKKISEQAGKHGIVALQAIKTSPKLVTEAIEKLPAELVEHGLHAIAREPAVMHQIIREVGQEGLEVAAKHPGVGAQIVQKLGKDGAVAARELTNDMAVKFAKYADDVAKLPAKERTGLLAALKNSPGRVLSFLEKHPKSLLTIAAVSAFLIAKDDIIGDASNPGFFERVFAKPVNTIFFVLAALLGVYGLMRIWFVYRSLKKRSAR